MPVAPSDFTAAFPEFTDASDYPVEQIAFWLNTGYQQLNTRRFGIQAGLAVMLFAAHNVVLSARARKATRTGQVPGVVQGALTSKALGGVSAGYADNTSIDGAGAWNLTTYGQRLYQMMRVASAGPTYVRGRSRHSEPAWYMH
jgi:hypothetical protein